ncbi:MAG: DUF3619 family protein [Burkholderiales bacterium]|nr:DUF3619 family protein [Burkholderiales bacterium]
MNHQDHELAGKIVRHLNYGADQIDPAMRERLLAARKEALSHYKDKPEPAWGLAWAGHTLRVVGHRFETHHLIAAAALIVALIAVVYWQNLGPSNDFAEIDLGLLTDDLPINAYLDRGFDSWLKRSSR